MLTDMALLFLGGWFLGELCKKTGLPALVGMLLAGVILGPGALGLLQGGILAISAPLRQLALVIILARAGLALHPKDLLAVGRPALLLCFLPATFEILGMLLLAPPLLGVSVLEAGIIGAVVAAVSPAVVVPRMLALIEDNRGQQRHIPQMIMAGASVDDVFVIGVFTARTGVAAGGGSFSPAVLGQVPISILLGAGAGALCGLLLGVFFARSFLPVPLRTVLFLAVSFLLLEAENQLKGYCPFSGLLGIVAMGMALLWRTPDRAAELAGSFSSLWVGTEILLFSLVGAAVDLRYLALCGLAAVCCVAGGLIFRALGVLLCVIKTPLCKKERLFCAAAYLPKATVQAAIGGVPLAMGLGCGSTVLAVAVVAILLTAPLGALLIDKLGPQLLKKDGGRPV